MWCAGGGGCGLLGRFAWSAGSPGPGGALAMELADLLVKRLQAKEMWPPVWAQRFPARSLLLASRSALYPLCRQVDPSGGLLEQRLQLPRESLASGWAVAPAAAFAGMEGESVASSSRVYEARRTGRVPVPQDAAASLLYMPKSPSQRSLVTLLSELQSRLSATGSDAQADLSAGLLEAADAAVSRCRVKESRRSPAGPREVSAKAVPSRCRVRRSRRSAAGPREVSAKAVPSRCRVRRSRRSALGRAT